MGPAPLGQAHLHNAHPTGKFFKEDRLHVLMQEGGIADCGNAQNCVEVCPKDIPLTRSIAKAGRATTVHTVRRWLSRQLRLDTARSLGRAL